MKFEGNPHFISDEKAFTGLMEKLCKNLRLDAQFPEQVFQRHFKNFLFFEFGLMLSGEFWPLLTRLAELENDTRVGMMVIEPSAGDYYFKEFGKYAAIWFEITGSSEAYSNTIASPPEGSPADALLYRADTIVWYSNSMRWVIWGGRDFGIGVLGFSKLLINDDILTKSIKHFTVEEALSLMALNYEKQQIPSAIASQFRTNYGK